MLVKYGLLLGFDFLPVLHSSEVGLDLDGGVLLVLVEFVCVELSGSVLCGAACLPHFIYYSYGFIFNNL